MCISTADICLNPKEYSLLHSNFSKPFLAFFSVFAIQNGGSCLSGPKADETFMEYGESAQCKSGKGGVTANDVYRMNYDGKNGLRFEEHSWLWF